MTYKYQTLSELEHILKRPETFIGTVNKFIVPQYIASKNFMISKEDVNISEGLIRIFIEVLANAIDVALSPKTSKSTFIKVEIYSDGKTCITNDGDFIPITKDNEKNIYNHELVFGNLRTSSNYDDTIIRETSGKNGVGVKCTNIFSTFFKVTGVDTDLQLKFEQIWTNNMRETKGPYVTKLEKEIKKSYTKIEYIPDFSYFENGKDAYDEDTLKVLRKHVIDAAMVTDIPIIWNKTTLKIKTLLDYSSKYIFPDGVKLFNFDTILVAMYKTRSTHSNISFVNGILTRDNGTHVDGFTKPFLSFLLKMTNAAFKIDVSEREIKEHFSFFVNAKVDKPLFEGQSKHKLKQPISYPIKLITSIATCVFKSTEFQEIASTIVKSKLIAKDTKTLQALNKKNNVLIDNYDKANNAGTKHSKDCVLILCEGLSAKTFAVSGIKNGIPGTLGKGRDWFGILPLKGKFLNVRNVSNDKMLKNKIVLNLVNAIGLKFGTVYDNIKALSTLNYGKLLILPDPDTDGIHIEGLVINFFDHHFKSLLVGGFIQSMKIPIIKTVSKNNVQEFYSKAAYQDSITVPATSTVHYFKGLGTVNNKDVDNIFGKKMVIFAYDADAEKNICKAFQDNLTDERKQWLQQWCITNNLGDKALDDGNFIIRQSISSFINNYLIQFSIDDCKRSLPNIMDGLKESQRKVVFGIRKQSGKIKVAQLAGFVAQKTDYKHGEENLCDTIVKMAQDFIGSNNIPLLEKDGQFGTRLHGGQDAASPRYIHTKQSEILKFLIRKEDDDILEYSEEGEPLYYLPILPLILVNGSVGIGTGFSCSVPLFNPLEIWNEIYSFLGRRSKDVNGQQLESVFSNLIPWYKNFKGEISFSAGKYISKGVISDNGKEVTELPVGLWTDKFKEYCEEERIEFKNYSDGETVKFVFENKFENTTKLKKYIHTTNMVMFNSLNTITKYDTVSDIIREFCNKRLYFYEKRRLQILSKLHSETTILKNKIRFVTAICNNTITIVNIPIYDILDTLDKAKYHKAEGTYNYLLNMNLLHITKEQIEILKKNLQDILNYVESYKQSTPELLWLKDLEELKPYIVRSVNPGAGLNSALKIE